MERLKKRRDYLAAARGAKAVRKAFILQSRRRQDGRDETAPARFGFTVTRRTARNAVDRNRIRRRLKEAARLTAPAAGHDFVLIGRREALSVRFSDLVNDLKTAIVETSSLDPGGAKAGGDNRSDGRAKNNPDGAHDATRRQT